MIKIYPQIDIGISYLVDEYSIKYIYMKAMTRLRKLNDKGEYYFIDIVDDGRLSVNEFKIDEKGFKFIENQIKRFHHTVYVEQTLHKYNDKIININIVGRPLDQLDPDQIDESQRLLKLISY